MTLILALECAEGLVLASDGQVTFETGGQHVKGTADKLIRPWNNIAWGASGPGSVIQHVDQALRTKFSHANVFEGKTITQVRTALGGAVAETVRKLLNERYVKAPGGEPWTSFLFVGQVPQGPFILEVHDNLLDSDHTPTGYAAIGSGDIFPYFAMAALAHFQIKKRSLQEAKMIACRIIEDAINVAAYGLGEPIQMIQVEKVAGSAGVATKIPSDELRVLKDKVLEWKQVEGEALSKLVGLQEVTEPTAGGETVPVPEPETIQSQ